MSKKLQLRGGTTSQHNSFTGAIREVTVDTDKDTLVVHDGSTQGGFALPRTAATIKTLLENGVDSVHYVDGSIDEVHLSDNSVDSRAYVDGSIDHVHLAGDAVDGDNLANDACDSEHYTNGSIDGVHIANSAALGGNPTTTTQAESDDSTRIATTAYVVDKITTLIGGAPSTLNDLNELAAAINDDASYNSTLTTALGTKLPKAGGAMTGDLTISDSTAPQLRTKTALGTSAHESGGGFSHVGHATAGSRRAMVWLDADGGDFGGSDYFYIEKVGGGAAAIINQANTAMTFATNGSTRLTIGAGGAVTVAGNAIVSGNLTATLQANAIDSQHYVDGSIDLAHMSANSVDTSQIVNGAVGINQMSANSIDSASYVDGSIDEAHFANGAVNTNQIQDDAVTAAKMAANSVDSSELVDGSVDASHLASNAVTTAKIAAGNVTVAKMAANSVDSAQYVDGSIDSAHYANNSVTGAKLALDHRTAGNADDVYMGSQHDYVFADADTGLRFYTANAEDMRLTDAGALHVDGDVIAFSTTISDERLKHDIEPITDALSKVGQLNGCTFTYNNENKRSAGLIAQDVEKVLPSAVSEVELPLQHDDGIAYKTVQYDQTIGLLVEAIKELTAKVEELEAR